MEHKIELSSHITVSSSATARLLVTHRGAVTFLDVLGWKGIRPFNGHDPVIALEQTYLKTNELCQKFVSEEELNGNNAVNHFKVISLSDTIVIATYGLQSAFSDLRVHGSVCKVLLPYAAGLGPLLRGATGYGEHRMSDIGNILIGTAIDQTASVYEQCDWSGVCLTPQTYHTHVDELPDTWTTYHKVPFKTGATEWGCLDWELADAEVLINDIRRNGGPIGPDVMKKYQNTLEFLNRN